MHLSPPRLLTHLCRRGGAMLLALLAGRLLAAPQYTQTISLQNGWNAVYLEVEPTNNNPSIVFKGLPLDTAWSVQERLSSVDYIQDAGEALWNAERFAFFVPTNRPESRANRLFQIQGHKPYLLKLTNSATWNVTGTPAVTVITWAPDAFNLRGLPVDPVTPPTFQTFFRPSPAHYSNSVAQLQPIYRLSAAGTWTLVTPSAIMKSGEAYWVYCKGGSDFQGPLTVELPLPQVLDFSDQVDDLTLNLRNLAASPGTITVRDLKGPGTTPLAYYYFDPASGPTWPALPTPFPQPVLAGSNVLLRLAIRRTLFSGQNYDAVLSVSDGIGTRVLVPVTASKSALSAAGESSGSPAIEAAGHSGLWIGTVSIDSVSMAHSGTLVTNGFDSQGKPLVVERVGFDPTPKPVHAAAQLRLLVHVDTNGVTRLLKQVIQMWQPGTTTNNADGVKVPAVAGHYVLLTDDSKISLYQGVNQRDGEDTGRRYSTVAYDFLGQTLPLAGMFAYNHTLAVTNTLPADWPTNPFYDRFHPDHQPLNSYDITRAISFQLLPPGTNAPPDYGDTRVDGIYNEVVNGLHKTNIVAHGTLTLMRVSRVGVLNQ